jgi:hypothetical protein
MKHFGFHAVYFLCNFLIRIPKPQFKSAQETVSAIPKHTFLMGVHLRLQFPGQFYSYGAEQTMKSITPFLTFFTKKRPTVFGLASDSPFVISAFREVFGTKTVLTRAMRVADADHDSALLDIALLEMANDCLMSFRSTFSFVVTARRARPSFWVEKEGKDVFKITSSQAGAISMLFHYWNVNDWQLSRRCEITEQSEFSIRFYFKYFIL